MSIFGWDLPPGVTSRMIDEAAGVDQPCAVCGNYVDDCVCPECPVCGAQGDPQCYVGEPPHIAQLTPEQQAAQARAVERDNEQRAADEAEAQYWASHQHLDDDA